MKTLSFVISDIAHSKLREIQRLCGFKNIPETVEALIHEAHQRLKSETEGKGGTDQNE